jgi:mono/diheme cytochrome c family protein
VRLAPLAIVVVALAARASADEPRFASGEATFRARCAVCHRATGAGTPGLAPPLTADAPTFLASVEGRRQLALTVLFGMYGDIEVGGRHYNFKMPSFATESDEALAEALNHVLFDLAHADASLAPLTAAEIASHRAEGLDGSAVRAHRAEALARP